VAAVRRRSRGVVARRHQPFEMAPLRRGFFIRIVGAPLWLDAHDKYRPVAVQRLVVAQDTGDGITGPLRGDFYWGSGKTAQARGGDFYTDGQYWVLLPKNVATKMVADLN
jgi:membrane-bound lytic murein transglycosylase